jgi:hypothetical protein
MPNVFHLYRNTTLQGLSIYDEGSSLSPIPAPPSGSYNDHNFDQYSEKTDKVLVVKDEVEVCLCGPFPSDPDICFKTPDGTGYLPGEWEGLVFEGYAEARSALPGDEPVDLREHVHGEPQEKPA